MLRRHILNGLPLGHVQVNTSQIIDMLKRLDGFGSNPNLTRLINGLG